MIFVTSRNDLAMPAPTLLRTLLIAASALLVMPACVESRTSEPATPRAVAPRGPLGADEQANIDLFRKVSPSVVHITTLETQRDMFSMNVMQVPRGTGTGFVWDDKGHIVTNFHVIQGGSAARVTTADQSSFPAKLVGAFPDRDLAVLKIEAPQGKLPPIAVGTSRELLVGQRVYAIGNPFGLDQTLTMGIVSALNREIESFNGRTIRGVVQTDAAINPGNSGGPLVDGEGRVVGINTAISSRSGGNEGVGFAIPVALAKSILDQLRDSGKVERGWLGIGIQDVTPELASSLDLGETTGALVANISPDSPAARGGVERGDVIVEYDGKPISESHQLPALVAESKIGSKAHLTVFRNGGKKTLDVTIAALPEDPERRLSARDGGSGDDSSAWGFAVADITPQLARGHRLARDHGVVVTDVEPEGAAAEAGMQPGDIVREVDRAPVESSAELRKALQSHKKDNVLLLVQRGDATSFQVLKRS